MIIVSLTNQNQQLLQTLSFPREGGGFEEGDTFSMEQNDGVFEEGQVVFEFDEIDKDLLEGVDHDAI